VQFHKLHMCNNVINLLNLTFNITWALGYSESADLSLANPVQIWSQCMYLLSAYYLLFLYLKLFVRYYSFRTCELEQSFSSVTTM